MVVEPGFHNYDREVSRKINENLFVKLFEHFRDAAFNISPMQWKIMHVNPKALEKTGYLANELNGLSFDALFQSGDRIAVTELLTKVVEAKTGYDPHRTVMSKSGESLLVELTASIATLDGETGIVCIVRDQDEKTQGLALANEMLMEINTELADVMNNIREGIFTVSADMKIDPEYSNFVREVFGGKVIVGTDIGKFLFEPDEYTTKGAELKDLLTLFFENPSNWSMVNELLFKELRYVRHSQGGGRDVRDLKLEWVPIFDSHSRPIKVMAVVADLTEQKRLQAEIKRKDAAHAEQLEILSQVIRLPREIVDQLVNGFVRLGSEAKRLIDGNPLDSHGLKDLMRVMHTIKGSARHCRLNSIQARAHAIETTIASLLADEANKKSNMETYETLLSEVATLSASLDDIRKFYDKVMTGTGAGLFPDQETITVPLEKIQAVLAKTNSKDLKDSIRFLLNIPIKSLFDRLEQVARSLSNELSKKVEVVRTGDDVEVDIRLVDPLYEALLHVIRNSMDHAFDTSSDPNKNISFQISLHATIVPEGLKIEIADNGRGIDLESVKKKVIEKKLIDPVKLKTYSDDQIIQLVFLPGFSTKDVTTDLSGRGFGMDIVKETIEKKLSGRIHLFSSSAQAMQGTKLVLTIPAPGW